VFRGFKNFLMRGELIVIAVGLVVALAFNSLIQSFTNDVVSPLINALAGNGYSTLGLGWYVNGQWINAGNFIAAIIYFVIFMSVIYFVLVVPYRSYMAKHGTSVFGDPVPTPPTKTCPECLSSDLPLGATRCRHCGCVVS